MDISSSRQFTVKVSERSMRRVQVTMAAVQAAEQTAQASAQAANSMVAQARKSLDEALGAICDAHDEQLPEEYSVSLRTREAEITITATPSMTGSGMYPTLSQTDIPIPFAGNVIDATNGVEHAESVESTQP